MITGEIDGRPVSHEMVSKLIRRRSPWPYVLHAAIYLCWYAVNARVATADETLGDGGLVHGIAHAMEGYRPRGYRERLASLAERLEHSVPGWIET